MLGENDRLIEWPKPAWNPRWRYTREEWEAMPKTLTLRQIKVEVATPDFRARLLSLYQRFLF